MDKEAVKQYLATVSNEQLIEWKRMVTSNLYGPLVHQYAPEILRMIDEVISSRLHAHWAVRLCRGPIQALALH